VTARSTADAWEAHAEAWSRWARTPGHDFHYEQLNLPRFLELLPAPRLLTVDVACGEGRFGRVLADLGHAVVGVDSSPTLVRLARAAGGYREVLHTSADSIALPDGAAGLVTSFMALHDMDDLAGAIGEAARLLAAGGRLCFAVPHPFAEMARERPGMGGYFTPERYVDVIERAGVSMTFESWRRPLSDYTCALERAGFWIEALREPVPSETAVAATPALAKWREQPMFLHVRARLGSAQ
jgi:SAM-dependent methyltransferase